MLARRIPLRGVGLWGGDILLVVLVKPPCCCGGGSRGSRLVETHDHRLLARGGSHNASKGIHDDGVGGLSLHGPQATPRRGQGRGLCGEGDATGGEPRASDARPRRRAPSRVSRRGIHHRGVPQLVEERLGHGHFGEHLVEDGGSSRVVGDGALSQLQPLQRELRLELGQLQAGRRGEQGVRGADGERALLQELGSAARGQDVG